MPKLENWGQENQYRISATILLPGNARESHYFTINAANGEMAAKMVTPEAIIAALERQLGGHGIVQGVERITLARVMHWGCREETVYREQWAELVAKGDVKGSF